MASRTSDQVSFFKIVKDDETGVRQWQQYTEVKRRGFLYYIKGNVRIQICTEDRIYFYQVDMDTLLPKLENVMFNYMNCVQMMIGPKARYCVTYKVGEKSFSIMQAKYLHNFKVPVVNLNLEGSKALEILSMRCILVSRIDSVYIYDSYTFNQTGKLEITLLESVNEREPNQVLSMRKSQDENYVAVVTGKHLLREESKFN